MELKVGKFYIDANWEKVGPIRKRDLSELYDIISDGSKHGGVMWKADGTSYGGGSDPALIAEWVEENNGPDYLYKLGLAEGDVVQFCDLEHDTVKMIDGYLCVDVSRVEGSAHHDWTVISRAAQTAAQATPEPATFGELSDAEQGAFLLAQFRGDPIEYRFDVFDRWELVCEEHLFSMVCAYRIAPTRVTGTVEIINCEPDFTTWKETK